jgi:hypothetical protein
MIFALTENKRTSLVPAFTCTCFKRNLTTESAYTRTPDTVLAMDHSRYWELTPPQIYRQTGKEHYIQRRLLPGTVHALLHLTTAAVTHSVVLIKLLCHENYG